MSHKQQTTAGILKPYVAGGSAAVVATMCVHPVDLLKTRVQVQIIPAGGKKIGSLRMAKTIVQEGGITKLYAGLSAAILRQAVYGTARLGLHDQLSKMFQDRNGGKPIPFYQKVAASMISGAVGGLAGNPFDIAMVRMQADGQAPIEQRRGYTNVFTPFAQLYHYESKSRGLAASPAKRKRFASEVERFQKRWAKQLAAGDPCMNPNFDLMKEDFSFDIKPLE